MGSQVCEADLTLGSCDCGPPVPSGGTGGAAGGTRATAGKAGASEGGSAAHAGSEPVAGESTGEAGAPMGPGGAAGTPNATGEGGTGDEGGGGPCGLGDVQGCRCDDQVLGHRDCVSGAFGDCNCQAFVPDVVMPGCVSKPEVCNQLDDDCDGVVDEQFACPDASVKNTQPFGRGVYLGGHTSSQCGSSLLQRFWPTLAPNYVGGLSCSVSQLSFPEFDEGLYFVSAGVYRKTSAPTPTKLPTPACFALSMQSIGFDGAGTLHYACAGILRRGDGEVLTGSVGNIVAVLSDGRVIVTRGGPTSDSQFVVLGRDGSELARFPPYGMFSGRVSPAPASASTAGNRAYVGLTRSFQQNGQGPLEILVYAVDEDSTFRMVRRLAMPSSFGSYVVVSDGTVFAYSLPTVNRNVTAYLPNDTTKVAWKDTDTPAFQTGNDRTLLVGPLNPNLDP